MKSVTSVIRKPLHNCGHTRAQVLAIALCLVALLTLTSASLAQVLYGTLTGTITDKTGAVVPHVSVTLTNQDTGQVRTTMSNEPGDYLLSNILPGTYTVSLQDAGFAGFTQKNITIEINRQVRIDIALQPAGVTQVVTVTGATPILQTETAEVNHEITDGADFAVTRHIQPGPQLPVPLHHHSRRSERSNRTRPLPTRRGPCRSTLTASKI